MTRSVIVTDLPSPAGDVRAFEEMSRSSIEPFLMSLPVMSFAAPADTEAPRKKVMAPLATGWANLRMCDGPP